MGLEQYAMHCDARLLGPSQVDFEDADGLSAVEFHYWRKHPNLHGWMEELYREKGGTAESFNCIPVRLLPEDLDRLEADIKSGALPETTGSFFGRSQGTEDEAAEDLEFVAEARKLIAQGRAVYYTSWW
jgi:hypothetical protein